MISPPTDSLYKFIAISGLIMIIWGLSFPLSKSHEYELQTKVLKTEIEINKELSKTLSEKATLIDKKIKEERKKSENSLQIEKLRVRQRDIRIKLLEAQTPIDLSFARISVMQKFISTYQLIGICSFLVGVIFVLVGFIAWYTRLQRYIDRDTMAGKNN